ncbi:ATP synthase subunit b [Serratia symbiotica]|nr:ATP synthase subunit b [Serratia symbiotica]
MNLNSTILGQAIEFILFVLFCMKYVWPPIMLAIEKRQKEIADSFALAESAKKDLHLAQANAVNHLNTAKVAAQALMEQARKRKVQILDETKVEAEQVRNKITAQTQADIESECVRASEELRKQVATLAIAGVEKIIERSVDKTTNSDIINKMIAGL